MFVPTTAHAVIANLETDLREARAPSLFPSILERYKLALFRQLTPRSSRPIAMALTLKAINITLARHHLRTRSTTVLSRPIGLVADTSNVCRLACPGCVHSETNVANHTFEWPNGTLHESRFSSLLQHCGPYAIGINFFNYGEPLLNRNTPVFLYSAKRHLLRTTISTSLSVQKFDPEAYIESGLDCMILSIDGATQPVYQRFRRNGNLELVLHNLRRLIEARRKLRRRTPVLIWNFLAFEHNIHEAASARRMAQRLGVDLFQLARPFDVSWDDPTIRPANIQTRFWRFHSSPLPQYNSRLADIDASAVESAFEQPWPGETDAGSQETGHTCHWLYKNSVLDATGRILPCCSSPFPGANLTFGHIDADAHTLYNTAQYRAARAFFATGEAPANSPYCTKCPWNQEKVNIGSEEIWRYFHSADPSFFDARSLDLLASW